MLEWGHIFEGQPEWLTRFATYTSEGRLFVVDDGHVHFPKRNYRVRLFNEITAWGFVRDTPLTLEQEFHDLASSDGVVLSLFLRQTLQAKEDEVSLQSIVRQNLQIDALLWTITNSLLAPVIGARNYDALRFDPACGGEIGDAVRRGLEAMSPYVNLGCVYRVRSRNPAVDQALDDEKAAPLTDQAQEATRKVEDAARQRRRSIELDEANHLRLMQREADSYQDGRRKAEFELQLEQEARRGEQAISLKAALVEKLPNPADRLTPEQQFELERDRIRWDRENAELRGQMRAMGTLLKQPSLLPEQYQVDIRGLPFAGEQKGEREDEDG